MAIYGAGSNWDGDELKEEFFKNENYLIGWDINDANDFTVNYNSEKSYGIMQMQIE